ncbi:transcriptional repressor [Solemya pervernicosa gill symbiont]|uniref:Ferric uptake regulation protein n=2 Tax=Gammaproteobacteria incertae sedis TaxID=118884 RepID=A0A1T2L8C6_9GAMM|nr:transcriptional repressor [Candidatus Reidiella endopervernicosa]OOZ41331.1 transcriptional repressor [Solemya pervernicosa gill symbiont]QKQ27707.1 transcriptional repressor [Candidatus Reidiella endopervernicosa]
MEMLIENSSVQVETDFRELLREYDISPTQQRLEIAQLMLSEPQHLSADQVMAMLTGSEQHVSKATVYNTLGLFARKGLIREVVVDPTRLFYDTNTSRHHHFYNVDTSELTDVPADGFQVSALPEAPAGTEIEGVEVIVRLRASSVQQ